MQNIEFTKMVASGNDFIVIDHRSITIYHKSFPTLAKKLCDRKYGIGADGLLVLEKSKIADAKMRIFNADGSEAEMCGNGARCFALYVSEKLKFHSPRLRIETKAGIIESSVNKDKIRVKLTNPLGLKLGIPLKINGRSLCVDFINTGVPHTVVFVEGLESIDVFNFGKCLRAHKMFSPHGTNVDFVEVLNHSSIRVRTFERGVEDETLACGTGSVASALIFALKAGLDNKIYVHTKSGERLTVYFERRNNDFRDVWLEGSARIVYKGEYYV